MSSEQISADFSMQVSQTSEANLCFDYFPRRSQPTKYPNVLLIKPSIAAKRERGETWKRFVMDSSRMTVTDKSIPNMGTCGVH